MGCGCSCCGDGKVGQDPGRPDGGRNDGDDSLVTTDIRDPDPNDTETIQVKKVKLNVKNNTKDHHTDEFDITEKEPKPALVIRRGQSFDLSVDFNREFDAAKDDIRIVFRYGKVPKSSRGTHVEFMLSAKDIPKEWGGLIKEKNGTTLVLQIMTPPTIPIGKWTLGIDVVKRSVTRVIVYRSKQKYELYMLFNPWCKGDQVYLSDDKLLDEYILNDTGKIYSGSYRKISPKPWNFSQFEENVLECSLYLLERSRLKDRFMGDPIQICRTISAMVNSSDDNGVLTGNWSGEYDGGESPLSWAGSFKILNQYFKTKRPVKYGQCWVFSGVVTTVCRALGIPARSTTNFASAHDTDGSVTIDYTFDAEGLPIKNLNGDSVWNFHVWNDVWMARPDLPPGYGGWQAIDATPQERSDGMYCMGPTSLFAIKRGDIDKYFDGAFVFAEVNADKMYWVKDELTKEISWIKSVKNSVGKKISTFGPNGEREDITDQYKFREGTEEERIAVRTANLHSTRDMSEAYGSLANDVDFELIINDDTHMGDDIEVKLKMINNSSETRTINGRKTVATMRYTGVNFKDVAKKPLENIVIQPNSEEIVSLVIPVENHMDKTTDHCFFKVTCMASVKETKQVFVHADELRLRKPHLAFKAPDKATVGQTVEIEVSFVNPLPKMLTQCELVVESTRLQKTKHYPQPNVGAKETFVGKFELKPIKAGKRKIVANFNSAQIMSVNGVHEIMVSN